MKKTKKAWAGFVDGKIWVDLLGGEKNENVLAIYPTRRQAHYEMTGIIRFQDLRRVTITWEDHE